MRKVASAFAGFSLVVLAPVGMAWLQPAYAQGAGNAALPSKPAQKAPQSAPDALPGARTDKDRVTPAERSTADMKPTDALFDAINRGDIVTARDAISRGADLQGRSLLGMTPLELAVDLGRNDITFLILSYRGIDGALPSRSGPPPTREATAASARAARVEQHRAALADAAAQARAARLTAQATQKAEAQNAAPRSYASDGGAPVPSAGFLGFGR